MAGKMIEKKGYRLVEENYSLINGVATCKIKDLIKKMGLGFLYREDIEDVVSKVFEKILLHGDLFDPSKAKLSTWVSTISHNSLIEYLRTYRIHEPLAWENEDGDEIECVEVTDYTSAEDVTIARETERFINDYAERRGGIDALILIKTAAGYSVKEISKDLDMTPNAVSVRLFKMRREIKAVAA